MAFEPFFFASNANRTNTHRSRIIIIIIMNIISIIINKCSIMKKSFFTFKFQQCI